MDELFVSFSCDLGTSFCAYHYYLFYSLTFNNLMIEKGDFVSRVICANKINYLQVRNATKGRKRHVTCVIQRDVGKERHLQKNLFLFDVTVACKAAWLTVLACWLKNESGPQVKSPLHPCPRARAARARCHDLQHDILIVF